MKTVNNFISEFLEIEMKQVYRKSICEMSLPHACLLKYFD